MPLFHKDCIEIIVKNIIYYIIFITRYFIISANIMILFKWKSNLF